MYNYGLTKGINMDNHTIGLIFIDIAMALGWYKLCGPAYAIGSLVGSAFYFSFLR